MPKRIAVVEKILSANDRQAHENQVRLDSARLWAINLMASPGAGKTSLIERTVKGLAGKMRIGMINGDIATTLDADRGREAGATSVNINTGGNCHLDAMMVAGALEQLELTSLDLLIIENVGNLVCPADFKLGTHLNALVASIPEGDDKPYKYPGMYRGVQAVVINKIDLLPYVPFRMQYFKTGIEVLNPGVRQFEVSCQSGVGLTEWLDWLEKQVLQYRQNLKDK